MPANAQVALSTLVGERLITDLEQRFVPVQLAVLALDLAGHGQRGPPPEQRPVNVVEVTGANLPGKEPILDEVVVIPGQMKQGIFHGVDAVLPIEAAIDAVVLGQYQADFYLHGRLLPEGR